MRELTTDETNELARLRSYFPFRIIFGAIAQDGTFEAYAMTDKRKMNQLVRAGYTVYRLA